MGERLGFPSDHEPVIDVRTAVGRFEDFAAVVGTQRPGTSAHSGGRERWVMRKLLR